jgi:hypothetical protein
MGFLLEFAMKFPHKSLIAVLGLTLAQAAVADSYDYGGGWAVPSFEVSQSIIRQNHDRAMMDRKILGDRADRADRAESSFSPRSAPAENLAPASSLSFTASPSRRKTNLAKFVSKTRPVNPDGATKMEQLFASTDVIASIGQGIAPKGLRVDNVADAYAVYWITAWEAAHGIVGSDTSRVQAQGVKAQVSRALLATPDFTSASPAQKQEFAEALLVQSALISASMEQMAGDPAQKRAIAAAVRKGARAMKLDLDAMTLTENGFVPAKRGSSVDDRDVPKTPGADAPESALAANDDSANINYALIAAAGGAGLGGMFLLGKAMGRKS